MFQKDRSGSTVVEHLSHLPKVQGLSPGDDAGIGSDTMQTMFQTDRGGSKVVEHLSQLPNAERLSPADDAGIGSDKMANDILDRQGW